LSLWLVRRTLNVKLRWSRTMLHLVTRCVDQLLLILLVDHLLLVLLDHSLMLQTLRNDLIPLVNLLLLEMLRCLIQYPRSRYIRMRPPSVGYGSDLSTLQRRRPVYPHLLQRHLTMLHLRLYRLRVLLLRLSHLHLLNTQTSMSGHLLITVDLKVKVVLVLSLDLALVVAVQLS
jgi:hypothetical protein